MSGPSLSLTPDTGVQLKREAKLLTVIGLNTKHADCRIIFMLYDQKNQPYLQFF